MNASPGTQGPSAPASALIAAALRYAKRGWPVFPLHAPVTGSQCSCGNAECPSPGKHPRTPHGFKDATTNPLAIRRWWKQWPNANIAIATGKVSGIVVLDVDGPSGAASVEKQGGVAPTPQAKTGKGTHYYLRHPGPLVSCSSGKLPGVDVRGDHGYAVAPPSVHASGHAYAWVADPATVELAEPPTWLIKLAGASETPRKRSGSTEPGRIPEGVRNETLYRLGRSLHARGVAPATIRAALRSENRERCQPPLPFGEVDAIADHAAAQADRDNFIPAFDAADNEVEVPDVADESDDEERLSEPVSVLLEGKLPAIRWFVRPMLAVGNNGFIGAEPKVGKSWLGLDLARCVASGADFLGYHVPKARPVLYIQEEDSRRRVAHRLRRLVKGSGDEPPSDDMLRVVVGKGFRIDQVAFRKMLRHELQEFEPALVIVDVFNSVHSKDELNQQQMSEVLRFFTVLHRKYGCAFLLLHHFRKASPMPGRAPRGGQMLRGSSALHGWSENSLYLTPSGEQSFYVEVESKDANCEPFEVEIVDADDGGVRLEASPMLLSGSKAGEKDWTLVEKLFAKQGTATVLDVAKATGRDKKTAAGRLKKWVKDGRLDEEHLNTGGPNGTFIYRLAEHNDEASQKQTKTKSKKSKKQGA